MLAVKISCRKRASVPYTGHAYVSRASACKLFIERTSAISFEHILEYLASTGTSVNSSELNALKTETTLEQVTETHLVCRHSTYKQNWHGAQ